MSGKRCFIVGLDGGSWNVIQPLLEERKMPNLEELLRVSSRGTLRSTVPPVTCPAWLTFSTGLKPSRLGIYGFRSLRPGSNRLHVHSYAEVGRVEFWDVLMESGLSCGIINNPLVYPRRGHRGYVIPGFLTPQEEFRSSPLGLLEELNRTVGGYEVDHLTNVVDDETLLEDALRVEKKRVQAFAHLLKRYPTDFFLGVFTSTDRVCHRFLNRAVLSTGKEKEEAREAIAALYRMVDEGLGVVMEAAREEDLLVVMSDHGFAPRPWKFHLNQYLKDRGLLMVNMPGRFKSAVFSQRGMARALNRLGLLRWAGRKVPEGLRKLFPKGATNLGEILIHDLVDEGRVVWERTQALAVGWSIYLNTADRPRGTLDRKEAEAVRSAIREGLEEMRGPEGN
ncbi:MAG: alkaline phosphatase family protein [Actinomycetota bacterium]